MANPNNAVGTNGAFGGRTSVNAFNDVLSAFSGRGIVSGWACSPKSGLTVALGGDGTNRDVAIAEDASGNKTTINNISQSPVLVTVNSAPASNSRVDAVVAYIEDSPSGDGITDNPDVVNILVVSGTVASNPSRPTDSTIRTAITADGASGSTAYYAVLAYITIPTGTTDVDATMISRGDMATISGGAIVAGSITETQLNTSTLSLGETKTLNLGSGITLPVTAYNGTNGILTTGNVVFSGGRYLLAMSSVQLGLSTNDYQATISYRIDSGEWITISNWANFGSSTTLNGQMSVCIPITISSGTHEVLVGFGTNSNNKSITVVAAQTISATLTKVGY